MSQSGAAGAAGGTPGEVTVVLTVNPPTVTHPGSAGPTPPLATTGVPLPAEVDVALLAVVAGALVVRLTAGGTRELLGLLRRARGGAT